MSARPTSARRAVVTAALTVSVLAGCGGSDDSAAADPTTSPSPAATVGASTPDSTAAPEIPTVTPPASTPTEPASTAAAPVTAPGFESVDVCASIPTVEDLQPFFDEPLTRTQGLERGPGFDVCEVASDGIANVQFIRLTDTTKEESVRLATELGSPPVDVAGAAIPGTYFYSGVAAVVIDGVEYSAQAITMGVITDPNGADAMTRSTAVLEMWLRLLGLI
jgi:hypothetical protein